MRPIAKNSSLLLFLFMLAATCTKEKDEPVTNLKSLKTMREKTLIVDEQQSLFLIYTQSNNQYNELKKKLADANIAFRKDILEYDDATHVKYQAFKDQFLGDLLELNNNLEDLIEEVKTGPMLQ